MIDNGTHEADRLKQGYSGETPRSDRWMATLAHELRDPLNAIVMALEELHPVCADEPAARLARQMARDGAFHMGRIIEDVLDLCRCRHDAAPLRKQPVDLTSVVAASIGNARPLLVGRSHLLYVFLPPEPIVLLAHPTRMEQMLTNLLTNAAKYTQFGGRIELTAELVNGMVSIKVGDNGIGIAPDLLPHVFDLYFRGPAFPPHDGLGIGLSLVKSLANLHGGTVRAHSDGLGKGAEFVICLPHRGQTAESVCSPVRSPAEGGNKSSQQQSGWASKLPD